MQSELGQDPPFCGEHIFDLSFDDPEDKRPLVLNVTSTGYKPVLLFGAPEMRADDPEDLKVYGVYGNERLEPDNKLDNPKNGVLVQTISATLTVTVDAFKTITKSYSIKAMIINKCERVFLYKEELTKELTIGVNEPPKTEILGSYTSYLDHYLFNTYGFVNL